MRQITRQRRAARAMIGGAALASVVLVLVGPIGRLPVASAAPGDQFVSDLPFVGTPINGWGPIERDRSNGEQGAADGTTLRVGNEVFAKGLGVHAASEVRFAVPSGCTRFQARVGIDEEVDWAGSAQFRVYAATTVLATSATRTTSDPAVAMDVDVTGRAEIRLTVTDAGNGNTADHADWGNAHFVCGTSADVTAPTVLSTSPVGGGSGVGVGSNVTATFSEAMTVSSVSGSTVRLTPTGSSTAVAAVVSFNASSRVVTLDPSASLVAGTGYTATITGGASGVKDAAGNALAANFVWSFTTAAATGGSDQFVSDLPFVGTPTNGWGPVERDRSNGEQGATDGATLRIGTETFAKGLGTHAASEIRFAVPSGCTRFQARVGVDEEVDWGSSVRFQVLAGTTVLADSGIRTFNDPAVGVDADLAGRTEIRLTVSDAGDGNAADHADWGNARFVCGTTPPADVTPPTVSSTSPVAGASGVAVASNVTATFSEAMNASTVSGSTVRLTPTGSSTAVAAAVTFDVASRTVTLDPSASLVAGTGYTATITGGASGVKDAAGNALAATFTWAFTAAATAPVGNTVLASVSSANVQANADSAFSAISGNGRFVVFASRASNLVANDGNGAMDIFRRDLQTGETIRVSVPTGVADGNADGDSEEPSINEDGSIVVFHSWASNLTAGDDNAKADVFLRNIAAATTVMVSVQPNGLPVTDGYDLPQSAWPSISADGRYVAFDSRAANVVAGDTNGDIDVFVRDVQKGLTERISVTDDEQQAGSAFDATISADGKVAAFTSDAANLSPNGQRQVFIRDLVGGHTTLVSVSPTSQPGNGGSYDPSLSADGRYVMFHSDASDLVGGDSNGAQDVFRRDLQTGETIRVGTVSDDEEMDGADDMISSTGRYVVFTSTGALVAEDTNGITDVYVYDCDLAVMTRASVSTGGVQSNSGYTLASSISSSGRYVAFVSAASNLVAGDANGFDDVFVRDLSA